METPLECMFRQAHELGVSTQQQINDLVVPDYREINFELAFQGFLNDSPAADEDYQDEPLEPSQPEAICLRGLISQTLKAMEGPIWLTAQVGQPYTRKYEAHSGGLELHTDVGLPYDLVVMHTVYGRAEFGGTRKDGFYFNKEVSQDSVIVISVETPHYVGPPQGGPRLMAATPIKLGRQPD